MTTPVLGTVFVDLRFKNIIESELPLEQKKKKNQQHNEKQRL